MKNTSAQSTVINSYEFKTYQLVFTLEAHDMEGVLVRRNLRIAW